MLIFEILVYFSEIFLIFLRVKYVFCPLTSVKIEISPSSKLLSNLVPNSTKCVNLVILTKVCEVYLTFQMYFMTTFELFIPFDALPLR